jgi:hypothetical protein
VKIFPFDQRAQQIPEDRSRNNFLDTVVLWNILAVAKAKNIDIFTQYSRRFGAGPR